MTKAVQHLAKVLRGELDDVYSVRLVLAVKLVGLVEDADILPDALVHYGVVRGAEITGKQDALPRSGVRPPQDGRFGQACVHEGGHLFGLVVGELPALVHHLVAKASECGMEHVLQRAATLQHLTGGVADAALHRLRVPADDEAREVVQHGQSYRCRHAGMVTLPATGARKIGAPQHLPVPGKVEGCGRR